MTEVFASMEKLLLLKMFRRLLMTLLSQAANLFLLRALGFINSAVLSLLEKWHACVVNRSSIFCFSRLAHFVDAANFSFPMFGSYKPKVSVE